MSHAMGEIIHDGRARIDILCRITHSQYGEMRKIAAMITPDNDQRFGINGYCAMLARILDAETVEMVREVWLNGGFPNLVLVVVHPAGNAG